MNAKTHEEDQRLVHSHTIFLKTCMLNRRMDFALTQALFDKQHAARRFKKISQPIFQEQNPAIPRHWHLYPCPFWRLQGLALWAVQEEFFLWMEEGDEVLVPKHCCPDYSLTSMGQVWTFHMTL